MRVFVLGAGISSTYGCPITKELKDIALRSAKAVKGDFVAVDLVESESGLQVLEVEYTVEFSKFFPVLDKKIVDEFEFLDSYSPLFHSVMDHVIKN